MNTFFDRREDGGTLLRQDLSEFAAGGREKLASPEAVERIRARIEQLEVMHYFDNLDFRNYLLGSFKRVMGEENQSEVYDQMTEAWDRLLPEVQERAHEVSGDFGLLLALSPERVLRVQDEIAERIKENKLGVALKILRDDALLFPSKLQAELYADIYRQVGWYDERLVEVAEAFRELAWKL